MCKVIACVNEKGGVAKTTTVKNLSAALAIMGNRVLAIDLDPSANLSTSLGVLPSEDDEEDSGILKVFNTEMRKSDGEEEDGYPSGIVTNLRDEGFDLVTSSMDIHGIEHELVKHEMSVYFLRYFVEFVRKSYDYILIDCPAGLGKLVANGMAACDYILIPSAANFLDLEALQNVFGLYNSIKRGMKKSGKYAPPEICGIVFTSVRAATNNNRENMRVIREMEEGKVYVFNTFIPLAAKIPESDTMRMSIFRYDKNCIAAINYNALAEELLEVTNMERGE